MILCMENGKPDDENNFDSLFKTKEVFFIESCQMV